MLSHNRAFAGICFVAILLVSCYTKKQADEMCAAKTRNFDSTHVSSDTTTKEVNHKPDTVFVPNYLAGPIQWLENPCASLCDSLGKVKPLDMTEHKNGITNHLFTRNDSLIDECHDDSLMEIIRQKDITIEVNNTVSEEKIITLVKELHTKTWWETLYQYGFWIGWIFIILYFGGKGLKFLLKFISELKGKFP